MKKKILIILITVIIGLILVGCGEDKVHRSNDGIGTSSNRFIDTGDTYDIGWSYSVYYDSKTKIVHLSAGSSNASGIVVMYNTEGNPMTIDEYNKTK